jgi:hypothetical protein
MPIFKSLEETIINGDTLYNFGGFVPQLLFSGSPSPSLDFCIGTGFDDYTYSIADDGNNIIVGGVFNYYGEHFSPNVVRINKTTGNVDTTFVSPFGLNVSVYVIKPSTYFPGKYYVGGTSTAGSPIPYGFARLNSDGSVDNTFSGLTQITTNAYIADFVELTDGKIIIIGTFTQLNSTSRPRIAKLNSNGSLDTTFVPGGGGLNSTPFCIIKSQDDSSVFVGGVFTQYSGVSTNRLVKINSTTAARDNTFASGLSTIDNQVRGLAFDGNGNLWFAGQFTNYPNATNNGNGVAVVDAISGITASTIGFGLAYEDTPFGISYDSVNDRMIIISQSLPLTENTNSFSGITFYGRINAISCVDGSFDYSFGSQTTDTYGFRKENPGFQVFNNDVIVDNNGNVFVGGTFTTFSLTRYDRLIKLNQDGQSITRTNC